MSNSPNETRAQHYCEPGQTSPGGFAYHAGFDFLTTLCRLAGAIISILLYRCSTSIYGFLGAGILLCGTVGCQLHEEPATNGDRIQAAATVGMVADIVRNVGGPQVEVHQIMGSGVDPHLYKVTRDDVRTILQSEIVFYSGLMLEGKMIDTLRKLSSRRTVVAVTEAIAKSQLLEPEDATGHYDPHLWMDIAAWADCVEVVTAALIEIRPDRTEEFTRRASEYKAKLLALDRYAKARVATIPEGNRVLITSHDAFNYFGRAYGIRVMGVQGLSTESEAGLQQINSLVDLLVDLDLGAVFVESSVPQKNIRALIDGAAARGHQVQIGGELYSDAMGTPDSYEGTYVGMLEHNINTIVLALGGKIPTGGFSHVSNKSEEDPSEGEDPE